MGYKKEEQLDIGRRVYTGELSKPEAMIEYGIGSSSIHNYVNQYRESIGEEVIKKPKPARKQDSHPELDISAYQDMTKEELINELIKAKANELRAKKGYEVKGDGANREYISLNNKNTKS